MTRIIFELDSIQRQLAEKSATYTVASFHQLPGEDAEFKAPPQFDAAGAPLFKTLYLIGLSRVAAKIQGWILSQASTVDSVVIHLDIDDDDADFVKRLMDQASEAYVFAETYSTYSKRMSQHFRNFACEVIDTLVSYLALTQ
jgi:hypothetical protein